MNEKHSREQAASRYEEMAAIDVANRRYWAGEPTQDLFERARYQLRQDQLEQIRAELALHNSQKHQALT